MRTTCLLNDRGGDGVRFASAGSFCSFGWLYRADRAPGAAQPRVARVPARAVAGGRACWAGAELVDRLPGQTRRLRDGPRAPADRGPAPSPGAPSRRPPSRRPVDIRPKRTVDRSDRGPASRFILRTLPVSRVQAPLCSSASSSFSAWPLPPTDAAWPHAEQLAGVRRTALVRRRCDRARPPDWIAAKTLARASCGWTSAWSSPFSPTRRPPDSQWDLGCLDGVVDAAQARGISSSWCCGNHRAGPPAPAGDPEAGLLGFAVVARRAALRPTNPARTTPTRWPTSCRRTAAGLPHGRSGTSRTPRDLLRTRPTWWAITRLVEGRLPGRERPRSARRRSWPAPAQCRPTGPLNAAALTTTGSKASFASGPESTYSA